MVKAPLKKGKYIYGKNEDRKKYKRCPHCGFRIDTSKIKPDDKWHVDYSERVSGT